MVPKDRSSYVLYVVSDFPILTDSGGTENVGVFRGDKQGCLKLHQPSTWWDAKKTCFLEGAVLASPENDFLLEAMSATLQAQSKDTTYIYTGIHNTYSNKHYYTLEGTPMSSLPVTLAQDLNEVSDNTHAPRTDTCISMHNNGMLMYNNCTDVLPYFCFKRIDPDVPTCGCEEDGYKYKSRTKKCYKFYTDLHTWSEAFGICLDDGGHLAIINGDIEAQTLKDIFVNAENKRGYSEEVAFIGFKEITNNSQEVLFPTLTEVGNQEGRLWMTIHGQSLEKAGYNKWHSEQPQSTESTCGAMYGDGDLLDDFYCSMARGFICEKAPVDGRTEQAAETRYYLSNNV